MRPRQRLRQGFARSTLRNVTGPRKRSAKPCRRCSRQGRPSGRMCLSPRNSGTPIIGPSASSRPSRQASRNSSSTTSIFISSTPFAFQPGDVQDPRDSNGSVIYDRGVTLLETWGALEKLVDEGKCKAIGLSDIGLERLKEIYEAATIKPAVVHVESHPYLPEWELLEFCNKNGIVLQAFAALGHSTEPKLTDDPVITSIARRVNKTPAQVLLAWAVQRGTALLTTSKTPSRIKENFNISTLPEDAMKEISEGIKTRQRFNAVVATGVPGFIPRGR